jgi:tetratricopeptide (TPR) repeat protein
MGEAWRRHGSLEQAGAAYARAAELDPARLGARAGLQYAHTLRRLERLDEALLGYRKVAAIEPESSATREARVWIGRCLEESGQHDGAIEAYRAAVLRATAAADVLDASNRLAKLLVAKGDLAGAEEALQRADRAVADAAAEDAEAAPRLRKALAEMSARKALQRARDKRDGAHEDARRLEEARR